MNSDLARERQESKVNGKALCNFLNGGASRNLRRRHLRSVIETNPVFNIEPHLYESRVDRFVRGLRRARGLEQVRLSLGQLDASEEEWLLDAMVDVTPTYLHRLMFLPNVLLMCDEEQRRHWVPLCEQMKVLGCYAQTELGHGTNILHLETTARFLPETDEFEIHSPTPTSAKWWPGGLGRTGNHAMVMAQLFISDRCHGLHNFLVPLRSMEDHSPLPGVTVGDIGPKIGFASTDNGFLRFDRVRIPRRNMAMRFAQVDRDGRFTAGSSLLDRMVPRVTMVQVRALIVRKAGLNLARACTIAIRYSALRRQGGGSGGGSGGSSGGGGSGGGELQVLDYTSQQHRLLPLLASAYAFHFAGVAMAARLREIEAVVVGGGTGRAEVSPKAAEALLQQYHADSSGLKSFCSAAAADGIEDCRRSCGGSGYLAISGLPELLGTYLQNCTVEGENTVIIQQTARFLCKVVAAARSGKTFPEGWKPSAYLLPYACHAASAAAAGAPAGTRKSEGVSAPANHCFARNPTELRDAMVLEMALTHRAARLAVALEARLRAESAVSAKLGGAGANAAWNRALVEVGRVGHAHSVLVVFRAAAAAVRQAGGHGDCGVGEAAVVALRRLLALFGLSQMEREIGDFLEDGYLSQEQAGWVRSEVVALLQALRPDAVALVDAWDFSDAQLQSAIGKHDGQAYAALLAGVQRNPLNSPKAVARCNAEVLALIRGEPLPTSRL